MTFAGLALAGGQKHATRSVSAVVRPSARIEVQSTTSIIVGVTLSANAEALVWAAADSCSLPENPKVIPTSGIHHLSFTPQEVLGKNMVCLTSGDGSLRSFAKLPR